MFIDTKLMFSDAQALTATAVSTNVVDQSLDRNLGRGEALGVMITVDVAADFTTGDETYQFDLQTDDNAGFSSATVLASRAIVAGLLTAGSVHVIPVPLDAERYLRMNYTLAGTTPTVTITTHLQPWHSIDTYEAHPDGFTIS